MERIKRDTRHFAKRQLTWFRREQEVIWVNKNEFNYNEDRILEFMLAELGRKGIVNQCPERQIYASGRLRK